MTELRKANRQPATFMLDVALVEKARIEVGETDVIRSIEAALAAAIDYKAWTRTVAKGMLAALLVGVGGCFSPNTTEPVIACVIVVEAGKPIPPQTCNLGVGQIQR